MQGQSSPVQVKDPYTGSILMHVGRVGVIKIVIVINCNLITFL